MRSQRAGKLLLALCLGFGFATTGLAAAPFDLESVSNESTREDKLRKLKVINRGFQVTFGRSMKKSEVRDYLPLSRFKIMRRMLESSETSAVYAERLTRYASLGVASSAVEMNVRNDVRAIARPTDSLEKTLKKLARDRHAGLSCAGETNTVCFARWLVGQVAPSLGSAWVEAHKGDMGNWSYARLLEQITLASY